MATTAKKTCSNERDALRYDPMTGELWETGEFVICGRDLETEADVEEGCCSRCRGE